MADEPLAYARKDGSFNAVWFHDGHDRVWVQKDRRRKLVSAGGGNRPKERGLDGAIREAGREEYKGLDTSQFVTIRKSSTDDRRVVTHVLYKKPVSKGYLNSIQQEREGHAGVTLKDTEDNKKFLYKNQADEAKWVLRNVDLERYREAA